jgi:hypothetical protein
MSDDEERLDRLNYYNGQRLEAADFRCEQDYFLFVRRELNRSLYSDGIAAGLEVRAKTDDLHKVVVSPGLALDQDGREIILLEETEVQVMGTPSEVEGEVFGNYLCIAYEEETTALLDDSCSMGSGGGRKSVTRTWGGPSRIRAGATLSIRPSWPTAADKQVVLAQLELDDACAIRDVHTYVRKYAVATAKAAVHPFAIEGEADIGVVATPEVNVSKKIYFHVRGGAPDTVILYLRGERFSPFFYTELGLHSHDIDVETGTDGEKDGAHTHGVKLGSFQIKDGEGTHDHNVTANTEDDQGDGITTDTADSNSHNVDLNARIDMKVSGGAHGHEMDGVSVEVLEDDSDHKHDINATSNETGASLAARTSGDPLTYVSALQVTIDGTDYTQKIWERLGWTQIGDGTDGHDFVTKGTGELELTLFGVDLKEGEHILELRVTSGGGRVRYNLYVE